jgi:Flp pilus assembly protein TadG
MLARFWNNREGAVGPMLAIAFLPLMIAVGAAVDFSRINSARTAFQVALDSTALNLTKNAKTLEPDALNATSDVFNALIGKLRAAGEIVTAFNNIGTDLKKVRLAK